MHQNTPTLPRCTVQRYRGEFCDAPAAEDMPFPICGWHTIKLYRHVSDMTTEDRDRLIPPSNVAPAMNAANDKRARNKAIELVIAGRPAVYAARFPESVIKIGYTSNLVKRLASFDTKGAELIGFKVGTYEEEQAIHASLKPHVVRGREWYRPHPEVLAVVNQMRKNFGLEPLAA